MPLHTLFLDDFLHIFVFKGRGMENTGINSLLCLFIKMESYLFV